MKIEIPLKGGFNSQFDPEEVGTGFTEIVNLVNTRNGKFTKRQAVGNEKEIINTKIASIMHWLAPDGNYYYIVYDSDDEIALRQIKRFTNDYQGSLTIGSFQTKPDRIEIDNNGEFVRFTCGHSELPRIYQYIKRSLFWGSETSYSLGGFHFDYAHPRDLITPNKIGAFIKSIRDDANIDVLTSNKIMKKEMFSDESKTLDIGYFEDFEKHYYYSYSLVYDGVQESLLTETDLNTKHLNFYNNVGETLGGAIQAEMRFDLGTSLANWNPRITGINIYRGSTSNKSTHKKLITASLKDTDHSLSYKAVNDGFTSALYYVEGANFVENSLTGKQIRFHFKTVSNTDDFGTRTIRGNTKDCIFVDPSTRHNDGYGAIWNQFIPIVSDVQYDDIEHKRWSSGPKENEWVTTLSAGSGVGNETSEYTGYYSYLGGSDSYFNTELGTHAGGIRTGGTEETTNSREYLCSLKINCDDFPEIDAGASYPQTYKLSIMIGYSVDRLNAHMDNKELDYLTTSVGLVSGTEPTISNISTLTTKPIGKPNYKVEDFKAVEPQYMQGTFSGSTQISDGSDSPPGDGETLDYLNTSFQIAWINVTGDFVAEGQDEYLYIKVMRKSSQWETNAPIFIDNLVIAKTLESYKMYGGDMVMVSPTLELDSKDGHKDWAYISNGKKYVGTSDDEMLPDLHPESSIGHIFKNTKRAMFLDQYSGTNGTFDSSGDFAGFAFPTASIDNAVFSATDRSMAPDGIAPNTVDYWIVGNVVRMSGTANNNRTFTIKEKTATKLIFEESVISETVDNANAKIIPSRKIHISNNYQIRKDGNLIDFVFWDRGLSSGEFHPLSEVSSIEVGHKYATNANGRRFVANVNLDPNGENELHKDWIVFSELGQPDVLPISNYINIQDLQGGDIHGIETLLGDIVVFMDNGIFRISVPSSNPTDWSVSEAIKDVGCSVPDSIIPYNGGVFFAGKDNYYYLNPNFELTPVTNSIKNEYQSFYTTTMRAIRDFKLDRLILKIDDSNLYYFDLKDFSINEENWSKHTFHNTAEGKGDILFSNLDYDLFVTRFSPSLGTSYIKRLTPPDGTSTLNEVDASLKTGWIPITGSYGRDAMIRRVNIRYSAIDSVNTMEVILYANEDSTNRIWSKTLPITNEIVSLRVGRRAKNVQLCIKHNLSRFPMEIRRIEIEVD